MTTYLGSTTIDNLIVDQLILGQNLPIRTPVQVSTTVAGTLATSFTAGTVIDGYILNAGDRILIKNQASGIENGIYVVQVSGSPIRANDLAVGSYSSGILITCVNGTSNSAGIFICTNAYGSDLVGTNSLSFNRVITAINTSNGVTTVSSGGTGLSTLPAGYFLTGNGTSNVLTTYAAPSSTVVGTTDTQTLTNKTLTLPNITGSSTTISLTSLQTNTGVTLTIPNIIANDTIATQTYVQTYVQGLQIKSSCQAATFPGVGSNVNISNPGFTTLDGVTLVSGTSRILIKDQTTATENGIYLYNGSSSALTYTSDWATGEVSSGTFTFIDGGTVNKATGWVVTNPNPITIGTTNITLTQFSAAGEYIAGNGINFTSYVISTNLLSNGGLVYNGGALQVNASATNIAGTLATGNGGTGLASFTNNTFLTANSTNSLVSSKAVPTGVVIGDVDTQTLTNKTLTAPNIGTTSNYVTLSATSQTGAGTLNFPNLSTGSDTLVTLAQTQTLTNKTITSGRYNNILDTNGNTSLLFTASSTAVNYFNITNNSAGNDPSITSTGTDSNVNLSLSTKGTGVVKLLGATNPASLNFYNASNTYYTALRASSLLAANVSLTLPAAAGAPGQTLVTNGSGGLLSFATPALNRTAYSLLTAQVMVNLNTTANSPSNILVNSLFPWSNSRNGSFTGGSIVARIGNQTNNNVTLTVYSIATGDIVNPITNVSSGNLVSLGSGTSAGTTDSNLVFALSSLPSSDCLIVITAITTTSSGIQPTINGLLLEFNQ